MITTAMILAAGFGRRMLPLTAHLPKPLMSVAGKPILLRLLEKVREAGVTRIVVNSHYLAPLIKKALPRDVLISEEDEILETGGGVKKALPFLGQDPFFVLNGDSLWGEPNPFSPLVEMWDSTHMDSLLLLIEKEKAHGYRGKGDFFMSPTHQLTRCGDAPSAPYVYSGIQILHPQAFEGTPDGPFSLNFIWDELIKKRRLFGVAYAEEWFQIDTPENLKLYEPRIAQLDYLNSKL